MTSDRAFVDKLDQVKLASLGDKVDSEDSNMLMIIWILPVLARVTTPPKKFSFLSFPTAVQWYIQLRQVASAWHYFALSSILYQPL